jgi:GNAT superfamily N-acetyltransferase
MESGCLRYERILPCGIRITTNPPRERELEKVHKRAFGQDAYSTPTAAVSYLNKNAAGVYAYCEHKLAGFAFAQAATGVYTARNWVDRDHTAYFSLFAIDPQYQGRHLGTALFEAELAILAEKSFCKGFGDFKNGPALKIAKRELKNVRELDHFGEYTVIKGKFPKKIPIFW